MRLLTFVFLFISSQSFLHAQFLNELNIKKAITEEINGLLWDTLNEGEMKALVAINNRNEPDMDCSFKQEIKDPSYTTAKCQIIFDVENTNFDSNESEPIRCQKSCFLLYRFNPNNLNTLDRFSEAVTNRCMEDLSDPCE